MRALLLLIGLFLVLTPQALRAEEEQPLVRIEIDQDAKAFVFMIDDEPAAMLDRDGLHVPGEINYGHYLTDTGPEPIKKRIADRGREATDE